MVPAGWPESGSRTDLWLITSGFPGLLAPTQERAIVAMKAICSSKPR